MIRRDLFYYRFLLMWVFITISISGCSNVSERNTYTQDLSEDDDENKERNNREEEDEMIQENLLQLFSNLTLTEATKQLGDSNPLITQDYGADPYAMVYNNRVYVYMTQDVYMYDAAGNLSQNTYANINSLRCISSADMVNWTDHGQIHIGGKEGVSVWAKNSWAPTATWKVVDGKEKFFIYFADSARGIGVLMADSPIGPFHDPIGKPLITRETPNCEGVEWLFDPAVLIDDDGKAYLYFGGGVPEGHAEFPKTARVIELGEDMISTVGEAIMIDAPYLFEDSGINKIGDTYYYSYCSNFSSRANATGEHIPKAGEIIYMTSDSPFGPWNYQGSILKNPGHFFGSGGNNHHSMIQFHEKWYMFYHTQILQDAKKLTGGYRSTNVNEVLMREDGIITPIFADKKGVTQLFAFNPYDEVSATTMSNSAGISIAEEKKKSFKDATKVTVSEIESGDWLQIRGVDFGNRGANELTIRFASELGSGAVKVCIDALDGEAIAYAKINETGSFDNVLDVTVPVENIKGVHDLYFIFSGSDYRIHSWKFEEIKIDVVETLEGSYNTMLTRSLISTGNNYRMKKAIEKAKKGENVSIAYIGGSITEGAGASSPNECYAYQSYEYFKATYGQGDGSNITFVNAGMGGTPSALGIIRYDRDVTEYGGIEPDIVFIEFAVNDYQEPTNGEAYESLVRKVLSSKNSPAVVLLFSVFQSKWNMQDLYIPVGEYYKLPMISIKDAVVPELEEGRMTDPLFFADQYHPTTYGHTIMSDCIINYYKTMDEMDVQGEDFVIPLEAKIGNAYEEIQMIDSSYHGEEIEIITGGFSAKDEMIGRFAGNKPTFPMNWTKDKEQEDGFRMSLNCKNLLLVYKASSDTSYGTADIYVDSKLVMSIEGYQSGGWNNPITVSLIHEDIASDHLVEIKMSKDSGDKRFTILAFGYSK